ncbi:hypothetical protein O3P69_005288 [Scylla paramamosain]|uniref:Uncharacterized protein n=1 Tax=Scylla paramamosain TaxID=85552 RepID=A0AAW0U8K1_SCYPA
MAKWCPAKSLLCLVVFVVLVAWCSGSYRITTPQKWDDGDVAQVWLFNDGGEEVAERVPAKWVEIEVKKTQGRDALFDFSSIHLYSPCSTAIREMLGLMADEESEFIAPHRQLSPYGGVCFLITGLPHGILSPLDS